jgi:cation transport protein ChaC
MTDDADRAPDAPQACEPAISLTREFLMQNTLSEMMARAMPDVRLLSEAEREASLTDMLARRPPDQVGQGVWVFAYGSLIWNPAVHFAERRPAVVPGWQRAFCLSVRSGRGTQEQPGLMLGLVPGGLCAGAAFRIAEHEMRHELSLLWRREMLADGYIPRWVSLEHEGVAFASGIAFTATRTAPTSAAMSGKARWSAGWRLPAAVSAPAPSICSAPATACARWRSATRCSSGWRQRLRNCRPPPRRPELHPPGGHRP